jgi:hypothetical protein
LVRALKANEFFACCLTTILQNVKMKLEKNVFNGELSFSLYSDALLSPKLGPRWALVSKIAELWGI